MNKRDWTTEKSLKQIRYTFTYFAIISASVLVLSLIFAALAFFSSGFFLGLSLMVYVVIAVASLIALFLTVWAETSMDEYIDEKFPAPIYQSMLAREMFLRSLSKSQY